MVYMPHYRDYRASYFEVLHFRWFLYKQYLLAILQR